MLYLKFQRNLHHLLDGYYPKVIAIAVSGGGDSVALLALMHQWATAHSIKLMIMTVNHNLRAQAIVEVKYVMNLAQNFGYNCAILNWDHQHNFANLQEKAREARYSLMTGLCKQLDILTLLTAHHNDDDFENFIIRQERKSGILGLHHSSINFRGNIRILRPLFDIHKAELLNYLLANNISWFEDESNLSNKYKRAQIRIALAGQEQICQNKLRVQQDKINEQANIIKPLLIAAIAESVTIYQYGFASIELDKLNNFNDDIQLQLIHFVLTIISGNTKVPRARSSLPILSSLHDCQKFIKTLHGCVLDKSANILLIYREYGKNPPLDVPLIDGVVWDNRFSLDHKNRFLPKNAYITRLMASDYKYLKQKLNLSSALENIIDLSSNKHQAILFTLPVIKIFEKVIALPHISYYDSANLIEKLDLSFRPGFISRFTHFC
ncbi:tRNA lysidine(34) synthetase TilS [Candidatus Trichorickettsia mobilis]|uniref:tRNA lysidine(34) synthetase TilS n=1 Tax=Candidatus Trichorickettsia mobilis TaxID=1346319 RepID=UPI0029308398|nr:tRNA lysidine(34) synthetase TilS [Candidatus Trichorickettsia mobilis]